jgi:nucleoside-diphosphate-sugar epimerase
MKILVTGGLGFVGINLVRSLAESPENQVVAADLLPLTADCTRFLAPVAARVTAVRLDVRQANALSELVRAEAITHIVHAAAITATDAQERLRTTEVVAVNLVGAIHVLDAALQIDSVERVLLISSSGVYGSPRHPRRRPQAESDRLQLTNLYAITKYSAELLAARYAQLSGKMMASVRLPAVYGPMERSLTSRANISTIGRLREALEQRQPIAVAGAPVARDWTYAPDIGAAISALLTAPHWRYSVYNAGCGEASSLAEVVDLFMQHGLAAHWVTDPAEAHVAMRPFQERAPLDIRRLQRDTAFVPQYPIAAGLDHWLKSGW